MSIISITSMILISIISCVASNSFQGVPSPYFRDHPNLATRNSDGETALHKAVHVNDLELVKHLITAGANVNSQSASGWTPLHYAASSGNHRIVEELTKRHDINVNLPNSYFLTPLHLAAMNGSGDVVKELLTRGALVDVPNVEGLTALHLAAVNEHQDATTILLQAGSDMNSRLRNGSTLLHLLAAEGNLGVIQVLLEFGASLTLRDNNLDTPLILAKRGNHTDVVWLLKTKTDEVTNRFVDALDAGDYATMASLVLRGADIDTLNNTNSNVVSDDTPLSLATLRGIDYVKYLVEKGAHLNIRTVFLDATPLMRALSSYPGDEDVIQYLVEQGAQLDVRDSSNVTGWTALDYAIFFEQSEAASYLQSQGASVSQFENYNCTYP